MKKNVVIGFLGPTLDQGQGESRWKKWRPTVSAVSQDEIQVDRFELIYQQKYAQLLETVSTDIQEVSPQTQVVPHVIEFKDPWDFEEMFTKLHDFAAAYKFNPENENYLINITTGTHVAQICLFLLAESKYIPGKLYQLGTDHENRAKGTARIIDLDLTKYDPIMSRFEQAKRESHQLLKAGVPTKNKDFNQLIEKIEVVANRSKDPLLLMGKTGVGKTELARRIYQLKHQKRQFNGRFVEVNCATLKGDSAMTTLFGHKKGAFTGAQKDRQGLLKEADGGLLFLDEIGELGPDEQAMLLKAIEDKRFLPMGSDKEVDSDFQLIAGTNRDLRLLVEQGRFRDDLFNRINLWTFELPNLSNRREDIEPNIDYELQKYSKRNGKKLTFSKEGLITFLNFAKSPKAKWFGNFRDLNATITRMGTLSNSGRISKKDVEAEILNLETMWKQSGTAQFSLLEQILGKDKIANIDLFDRFQLLAVLEVCARSKSISEAGRELFAASRVIKKSANDTDRLKKYLAKFGVSPEQALISGNN